MPRAQVPLIFCCPSDLWGLPGALIPASSYAPRATVRAGQSAGRNAGEIAVKPGGARPSGPEAIRRPGAMRGLGCRRVGAAGRAGERRLGLPRRGPSGKG